MRAVGARGVVHTLQFNGKQEGRLTPSQPNLRCPRNGKQTRHLSPLQVAPLSSLNHWTAPRSGKVMKVVLPARIPANKVVVRLVTDEPP
jgi:hypothetical protein